MGQTLSKCLVGNHLVLGPQEVLAEVRVIIITPKIPFKETEAQISCGHASRVCPQAPDWVCAATHSSLLCRPLCQAFSSPSSHSFQHSPQRPFYICLCGYRWMNVHSPTGQPGKPQDRRSLTSRQALKAEWPAACLPRQPLTRRISLPLASQESGLWTWTPWAVPTI